MLTGDLEYLAFLPNINVKHEGLHINIDGKYIWIKTQKHRKLKTKNTGEYCLFFASIVNVKRFQDMFFLVWKGINVVWVSVLVTTPIQPQHKSTLTAVGFDMKMTFQTTPRHPNPLHT